MSVELQKLRSELLREALLKGWTSPQHVQQPWTQQLPMERIERWYRRLYKSASEPLPVGQRLLNHFTLGADPELVFHNTQQRVDASQFRLKAGPAFGADNNGRLCELRPAPSRSALSVLASLWLAMRWMVVYHPDLLKYGWRSGAFFEGDGLGGHVHFGRKRTRLREREVSCLDRLAHLQFTANLFDREEGRERVRRAHGAPVGQPYGALGDVRSQPHGWEYRTLPSWIDNPWLAYFNLVASKLVVALPDLVAPLTKADADLGPEQARRQLQMLLAYCQPLDDDARLAFAILSRRGWPTHNAGMDFKNHWGLFASGPLGQKAEATAPSLLPEAVPAAPEDERELSMAMFENRAPELTPLRPTWQPHDLPEGYRHLIHNVETKLAPGLGEFAMRLCTHQDHPQHLVNCGHKHWAFRFPVQYAEPIKRQGLLERLGVPADVCTQEGEIYINATKDYTLEQLMQAQQVVVESGIFPLWNVTDVRADSFQRWLASREPKAIKKNPVLFEGQQA
jgi:hypothetical protein